MANGEMQEKTRQIAEARKASQGKLLWVTDRAGRQVRLTREDCIAILPAVREHGRRQGQHGGEKKLEEMEDVIKEILLRVAKGEFISDILGKDRPARYPSKDTWYSYILESQEVADAYARAREAQADSLFEMTQQLSAKLDSPGQCSTCGKAKITWTQAEVQALRVRIDTLKWIISKLNPQKYSDYQRIDHGGGIAWRLEYVPNRPCPHCGRLPTQPQDCIQVEAEEIQALPDSDGRPNAG